MFLRGHTFFVSSIHCFSVDKKSEMGYNTYVTQVNIFPIRRGNSDKKAFSLFAIPSFRRFACVTTMREPLFLCVPSGTHFLFGEKNGLYKIWQEKNKD